MVTYDSYEIGPVLRDIRTKNNMTIEYVANQTGLSVSTICQIEQGGRECIDMAKKKQWQESFCIKITSVCNEIWKKGN